MWTVLPGHFWKGASHKIGDAWLVRWVWNAREGNRTPSTRWYRVGGEDDLESHAINHNDLGWLEKNELWAITGPQSSGRDGKPGIPAESDR